MEIITGYFISRAPALDAAEYLRNCGFTGKISVVGRHNKEDFRENRNDGIYGDDISEMTNIAVVGGFAGLSSGFSTFLPVGIGPLVAAGPVEGLINEDMGGHINGILSRWAVPREVGEEIKSVVESGSTVILIECKETEKPFIRNALQEKGAQNIHS